MQLLSESLEIELDLLRSRVAELELAVAQRAGATDGSAVGLRLAERVKELSALYRESYLADQERVSPDDYYFELAALLPRAWQHVGDACARILVNGRPYVTTNFRDTPWQQNSSIIVEGKEIGTVTVGYLVPHAEANEGPFLSEERSLLNEIAKRIGHYIERRQMETAHWFLAAIVESSENAIISVTLDGVIQTWNAAAERIYGYSRREVVGKSLATILSVDQYNETMNLLRRARDGYNTEQYETIRTRKDGTDVYVSVSLHPISDMQGRIVGVVVTARDISDRRMFEATMRESDERLRNTFEQAAVGLAHVSLDGRYMRVNQKLCAIVGYEASELLSMSVQQITHPDDYAAEEALMEAMLAGEHSTYCVEKRAFHKDGSTVWVNRTVSLARDRANRPKYFIVVVEDITQRKQAEKARIDSEARYRDLFENSPISLWEQDFSGVQQAIEQLRAQGVTDFRTYFEQHTEAVKACLAQVKLLAFNRASLALYGAHSREELLSSLDRFVPASGYPFFIDELVWIAEGRTSFAWEGVNRRLTGEQMNIRLHWSVAPGHETTLDRVLVSIETIETAPSQSERDA